MEEAASTALSACSGFCTTQEETSELCLPLPMPRRLPWQAGAKGRPHAANCVLLHLQNRLKTDHLSVTQVEDLAQCAIQATKAQLALLVESLQPFAPILQICLLHHRQLDQEQSYD